MPVLISMLRGVNLGPHNRIKMDELRALYESIKLEDPRTYVQSGNVIFRTKEKKLPEAGKEDSGCDRQEVRMPPGSNSSHGRGNQERDRGQPVCEAERFGAKQTTRYISGRPASKRRAGRNRELEIASRRNPPAGTRDVHLLPEWYRDIEAALVPGGKTSESHRDRSELE